MYASILTELEALRAELAAIDPEGRYAAAEAIADLARRFAASVAAVDDPGAACAGAVSDMAAA